MKKICEHLRERAKEKKMNLLTNEQQKPYQNENVCYICKKR